MTLNPYESPKAEPDWPSAAGSPADAPAYPLYSPKDVFLASFLGSVLGGVVLMALNYRRLGRRDLATRTLALGVVAQVVVLGLAFLLPDELPGLPVALGMATATWGVAWKLQEGPFALHLARGGKKGSSWKAAGIGLLSSLALAVLVVGALVVLYLVDPENEFFFGPAESMLTPYHGSIRLALLTIIGQFT